VVVEQVVELLLRERRLQLDAQRLVVAG